VGSRRRAPNGPKSARRLDATLALALVLGCGSPTVEPPAYAVVENGGVAPRGADCGEVSLRLDRNAVRALGRAEAGCERSGGDLASDVGAAYAYVQTETSAELFGPIVSDRVELRLLPSTMAGSEARGLATGAGERELASGGAQRELAAAAGQRELASGATARAVAADSAQRHLAAGAGQRELAVAAAQRRLASGATERDLAADRSERALSTGAGEVPALSVRKSVRPSAIHAGEEATFVLTFVNDGTARVDRIVLVDRVDGWVRVVDAPGARPYVLDDRSTLLVWDDREPLAPRSRRRYAVRVVARAPDEAR